MRKLKKILFSTPALLIYICVVVYAAQVAIVDTDTLNEAWSKETLNNSDLQTNIDGKEGTLTNSAGLLAALDDEEGTGLSVFNISPTLVSPTLGTIAAGVGTALTALNGVNIQTGTLLAAALDATNAPTDNYLPSYDLATGGFTWVVQGSGGGDATLAGDQEFTGANTFSGATVINRLGSIIFSDGTENMTSETFAFAANRTLKILDYNSQIAADALLDDTTGLLEVNTVDSAQYIDGSIDAVHLSTSAQVINTITSFSSPTTANPYTLTAANSYNAKVYYGATGEIDLPALADGMAVVIYNTGAFTITLDPNASEVVVRDGTAQAGGVSFTLSSGAGNFVCIVSDGTQWVTLGFKGTLAVGT